MVDPVARLADCKQSLGELLLVYSTIVGHIFLALVMDTYATMFVDAKQTLFV